MTMYLALTSTSFIICITLKYVLNIKYRSRPNNELNVNDKRWIIILTLTLTSTSVYTETSTSVSTDPYTSVYTDATTVGLSLEYKQIGSWNELLELGASLCSTNYCTVQSNMLTDGNTTLRPFCCEACSCEPNCWNVNNCCPDGIHPKPTYNHVCTSIFVKNKQLKDRLDSNKNYNKFPKHMYYIIDSCLQTDTETEDHRKCISVYDYEGLTIDDMVFVSDTTGNIYRNKYCAYCNEITDIIRWSMVAEECNNELLFAPIDRYKLAKYLLDKCVLLSIPPAEMNVTNTCGQYIVDSCPSTMTLPSYIILEPELIRTACEESEFRARVSGVLYKNIFCYICNTNNTIWTNTLVVGCDFADVRNVLSPFSQILNFGLTPDLISSTDDPYYNFINTLCLLAVTRVMVIIGG